MERPARERQGIEEDDRTEEARRVIVSLLGSADATRRFLEGVVRDHGLTLQQYNVLRILRGAAPEPLPTMEIGERMIEKTPGVTRFLDRLEGRGLVRRERSPDDRRRVHAWIADEGLELLERMDAEVDAADRRTIEGLSSGTVSALVEALRRIRANTEAA